MCILSPVISYVKKILHRDSIKHKTIRYWLSPDVTKTYHVNWGGLKSTILN